MPWCSQSGCDYVGEGGSSQTEWYIYSKTVGNAESIIPDDWPVFRSTDGSSGSEWTSGGTALGQLWNEGHGQHGAIHVHGWVYRRLRISASLQICYFALGRGAKYCDKYVCLSIRTHTTVLWLYEFCLRQCQVSQWGVQPLLKQSISLFLVKE